MKNKLWLRLFLVWWIVPGVANAQLQPGFDAQEYADLLYLQFNGLSPDSAGKTFSLNKGLYKNQLLTPEVGLLNRAAVLLRQDGVVVLNLRGTVNKPESWLENFYAGMVAARGSLQLSDDYVFHYKLSSDENAAVHIGWLLGVGFLVKEMKPMLDSLIDHGHRQLLIGGHSQGGALAFLTSVYLHYYFADKQIDVSIKTYASAAPKPGNQAFANTFDYLHRNQMGFRVINSADWVPETPFSLQTLNDMNEPNPFLNAAATINKQKFPEKMVMKHVYRQLRKNSSRASKTFRKYLGDKLYKPVTASVKDFERPALVKTMHYATAGVPVILMTDSTYHEQFSYDGSNVFVHHMFVPYMYLLQKHYAVKSQPE